MTNNINTNRLYRNISDMAYEGFLKIGFMADQPVRIYYDAGILIELLEISEDVNLETALAQFCDEMKPILGEVRFTKVKDRYECYLSPQGADYIHKNNDRRFFLKELIETLGKHTHTIQDVLPIFQNQSPDITVEETTGEFQYVVYFNDPSIDEFKYCFTFDEMGSYYHRLHPYDYERL